MNESEYYYNKLSCEQHKQDYVHEGNMNLIIEKQEYNLFSILKPDVSIDGDQWCVLYGKDLQDGITGFGDSLYLAILDFNKSFIKKLPTK